MNSKSPQIQRNGMLNTLSEPLKVGYSWGIQVMAWSGFVFLSGLFFMWVQQKESFWLLSSFDIVLVLLWLASMVGIIKFSQHIVADNQSIAVVSWLGKREIKWEEIQRIKIRKYLADVAICGADKKITVTAPTNWRGRDAQKLWDYLNTQVEERDIEVQG
ncbi:MAG: PH domain-containing protein [Anaerolineaceae bacterium]|nr:PH domain-containing protein [Anaerolineaceae bacterium]